MLTITFSGDKIAPVADEGHNNSLKTAQPETRRRNVRGDEKTEKSC